MHRPCRIIEQAGTSKEERFKNSTKQSPDRHRAYIMSALIQSQYEFSFLEIFLFLSLKKTLTVKWEMISAYRRNQHLEILRTTTVPILLVKTLKRWAKRYLGTSEDYYSSEIVNRLKPLKGGPNGILELLRTATVQRQ